MELPNGETESWKEPVATFDDKWQQASWFLLTTYPQQNSQWALHDNLGMLFTLHLACPMRNSLRAGAKTILSTSLNKPLIKAERERTRGTLDAAPASSEAVYKHPKSLTVMHSAEAHWITIHFEDQS